MKNTLLSGIGMYTKYHSKYFASELRLQRVSDTIENLTVALFNGK